MLLRISNIEDFSTDTLMNIIDTCNQEINSRKKEFRRKKIEEVCNLLRELHEIDSDEIGLYDDYNAIEYTWLELSNEIANYHNIKIK